MKRVKHLNALVKGFMLSLLFFPGVLIGQYSQRDSLDQYIRHHEASLSALELIQDRFLQRVSSLAYDKSLSADEERTFAKRIAQDLNISDGFIVPDLWQRKEEKVSLLTYVQTISREVENVRFAVNDFWVERSEDFFSKEFKRSFLLARQVFELEKPIYQDTLQFDYWVRYLGDFDIELELLEVNRFSEIRMGNYVPQKEESLQQELTGLQNALDDLAAAENPLPFEDPNSETIARDAIKELGTRYHVYCKDRMNYLKTDSRKEKWAMYKSKRSLLTLLNNEKAVIYNDLDEGESDQAVFANYYLDIIQKYEYLDMNFDKKSIKIVKVIVDSTKKTDRKYKYDLVYRLEAEKHIRQVKYREARVRVPQRKVVKLVDVRIPVEEKYRKDKEPEIIFDRKNSKVEQTMIKSISKSMVDPPPVEDSTARLTPARPQANSWMDSTGINMAYTLGLFIMDFANSGSLTFVDEFEEFFSPDAQIKVIRAQSNDTLTFSPEEYPNYLFGLTQKGGSRGLYYPRVDLEIKQESLQWYNLESTRDGSYKVTISYEQLFTGFENYGGNKPKYKDRTVKEIDCTIKPTPDGEQAYELMIDDIRIKSVELLIPKR